MADALRNALIAARNFDAEDGEEEQPEQVNRARRPSAMQMRFVRMCALYMNRFFCFLRSPDADHHIFVIHSKGMSQESRVKSHGFEGYRHWNGRVRTEGPANSERSGKTVARLRAAAAKEGAAQPRPPLCRIYSARQ